MSERRHAGGGAAEHRRVDGAAAPRAGGAENGARGVLRRRADASGGPGGHRGPGEELVQAMLVHLRGLVAEAMRRGSRRRRSRRSSAACREVGGLAPLHAFAAGLPGARPAGRWRRGARRGGRTRTGPVRRRAGATLGPNTPEALSEAETLLAAAADAGDVHSALSLAVLLLGRTAEPARHADRAVALLTSAADRGDAEACGRLADLHGDGLGVPQDMGRALTFLERAAEAGHRGGATRPGTRPGARLSRRRARPRSRGAVVHARGGPAPRGGAGWLAKYGA